MCCSLSVVCYCLLNVWLLFNVVCRSLLLVVGGGCVSLVGVACVLFAVCSLCVVCMFACCCGLSFAVGGVCRGGYVLSFVGVLVLVVGCGLLLIGCRCLLSFVVGRCLCVVVVC